MNTAHGLSVADNKNNISTTIQLIQEGCQFKLFICQTFPRPQAKWYFEQRDHFSDSTTIVGHVGKDASMSFVNPGKFSNSHFR